MYKFILMKFDDQNNTYTNSGIHGEPRMTREAAMGDAVREFRDWVQEEDRFRMTPEEAVEAFNEEYMVFEVHDRPSVKELYDDNTQDLIADLKGAVKRTHIYMMADGSIIRSENSPREPMHAAILVLSLEHDGDCIVEVLKDQRHRTPLAFSSDGEVATWKGWDVPGGD